MERRRVAKKNSYFLKKLETMPVEEAPPGTLPRFEYKVRRWTDERIKGLERVKYLER